MYPSPQDDYYRNAVVDGMRNCWYPAVPIDEMSAEEPYGISICAVPIVLWYHQQDAICAAVDVCPHRSAPLSLGRIVNGILECKYHGWQFDSDAKCAYIPSEPHKTSFQKANHAKQLPA